MASLSHRIISVRVILFPAKASLSFSRKISRTIFTPYTIGEICTPIVTPAQSVNILFTIFRSFFRSLHRITRRLPEVTPYSSVSER